MADKIGFGLKPLPSDSRDFTLGAIYGKRDMSLVPDYDFVVAEPLNIKNQYGSDFCTAFAGAAVSESQEGILLNPEWLFAQVKKGDKSWGANLREVCRVAISQGFIEQQDAPYTLKDKERDWLVDDKNWPDMGDKPLKHRKKSYFSIDIQGDIFDSFRSALWENIDQKCSILCGCIWEREWADSPGGIIPEEKGTPQEGHAFKIFGQKNIDGKLYLVAQLSNGEYIGDKGLFYFSREVCNRVFRGFGAYCFVDEDPNYYKKNYWNWKIKVLDFIKKIFL